MKLDRNIKSNSGRGKYALLKMRIVAGYEPQRPFKTNAIMDAIDVLDKAGCIEWGTVNTEGEFFVIKLRDAFSEPALVMYANTAMIAGDKEYAHEVKALADRAGSKSPFCKRPD